MAKLGDIHGSGDFIIQKITIINPATFGIDKQLFKKSHSYSHGHATMYLSLSSQWINNSSGIVYIEDFLDGNRTQLNIHLQVHKSTTITGGIRAGFGGIFCS